VQYLARIAALVAFFFLARRLAFGPAAAPWIALLLFAAAPGQVESVIWPSNVCDSLLVPAVLASLLLFAKAADQSGPGRVHLAFALSLVFFLAALASKEPAVIVPLLCLFLLRRERWRPALGWLCAFFAVLAGYLWMRHWCQHHLAGDEAFKALYDYGSPWIFLSRLPGILHRDLGVLIVGRFCQAPALNQAATWFVYLAIGEYAWRRLVRERRLSAAVPLLLCLLPIVITRGFGSSRYAYFPAAGFALMLGDSAGRLVRRRWLAVPALVLVAAICLLQAHLTLFQSKLFRQSGESVSKLTSLMRTVPSDEVLLATVPGWVTGRTLRYWQPLAYGLEPVYPEWIYRALRSRRATVVPLAVTMAEGRQVTSTTFEGSRLTLRHANYIGPIAPSILEARKRPDVTAYATLEKKKGGELVFQLKRQDLPIYAEANDQYRPVQPTAPARETRDKKSEI
jgi:hypothetical protein